MRAAPNLLRTSLLRTGLLRTGLLAAPMCLTASDAGIAADQATRLHAHPAHHAKPPAAAPVTTPPAPAENLVVHGQKRYSAAPMPNPEIHDPADALRDPATGAAIGKFGHAYMDANPVPPINPELNGDQSPIAVGVQR